MIPAKAPGLVVEGLTFRYASGGGGVEDVSFAVEQGETVALMGPSGAGKSTLLKVVAGLRPRERGRVVVRPGEPARRGAIGYIPQQLGLVRSRTALDNVLVGALARTGRLASALGMYSSAEVDAALALLDRVGLADKADRAVGRLSGGERQRVAIARTILQNPLVLLADEFTANLDVVKAGEALDLLREATRRGVATVVALHDVELAREYADRILFLKGGRRIAERPAKDLTHEDVRRTFA